MEANAWLIGWHSVSVAMDYGGYLLPFTPCWHDLSPCHTLFLIRYPRISHAMFLSLSMHQRSLVSKTVLATFVQGLYRPT
jgi:hypothetical protein